MRREEGIGFLGNSVANLVVGAAALGYAVIVPAAVVRRFGADLYGTWYLAFQVAAYVVLLDLGSQYVVTNEAATRSADSRAARLATAAMVTQLGLALGVLGAATAWAGVTGQAGLARLVAILGVAAVASLLASTVRAWFGGLERSHVPAAWLVGARVAALAGLGVAVASDSGLVALSIAVAVPQLVVYCGLLIFARRPPSPWARPDRAAFVGLVRSTLPLAIWTICGILIAGVDIFVVRALDPSEVGRYAVALPLLAIPIGIVTAATTAWMPRLAQAEAEGSEGGREPTLTGTGVMAAGLAIGSVPFIGFTEELVRLWAGPGDWGLAVTYLRLLYLACCLRFMFLPWTILVVIRGEQGRITLAPVTEAAVNLSASLLLGAWLGAVGVAIGTVVGALVAAVLYVCWVVDRTAPSGITPLDLTRAISSAWPPAMATAVLAVLAVGGAPWVWRVAASIGTVVVGSWWLLRLRRSSGAALVRLEPS